MDPEVVRASCPMVHGGEERGTAFCLVGQGQFVTAYNIVKDSLDDIWLELDDRRSRAVYDEAKSYPQQDIAVVHAPEIGCEPLLVGEPAECGARVFGYRVGWKWDWRAGRLTAGGLLPGYECPLWSVQVAMGAHATLSAMSGGPVIDPAREVAVGVFHCEESTPTHGYCACLADLSERWPEVRDALRPAREPARFAVPFPRNPRFVGRETDLPTLHDMLRGGKPVGVVGLTGIGGIGKTQSACRLSVSCEVERPKRLQRPRPDVERRRACTAGPSGPRGVPSGSQRGGQARLTAGG